MDDWTQFKPMLFKGQLYARMCVCVCMCVYTHICIPKMVFAAAAAKLLQLCLTLCNPIDGSTPGFPLLGILQARTLEWVAISFSNENGV